MLLKNKVWLFALYFTFIHVADALGSGLMKVQFSCSCIQTSVKFIFAVMNPPLLL